MDALYAELGKRLKAKCREVGITQEELAEKLGKGRATVSKWMTGDLRIQVEDLARVCDILNVSADWLLGRENELSRNTQTEKTMRELWVFAMKHAIVTLVNCCKIITAEDAVAYALNLAVKSYEDAEESYDEILKQFCTNKKKNAPRAGTRKGADEKTS